MEGSSILVLYSLSEGQHLHKYRRKEIHRSDSGSSRSSGNDKICVPRETWKRSHQNFICRYTRITLPLTRRKVPVRRKWRSKRRICTERRWWCCPEHIPRLTKHRNLEEWRKVMRWLPPGGSLNRRRNCRRKRIADSFRFLKTRFVQNAWFLFEMCWLCARSRAKAFWKVARLALIGCGLQQSMIIDWCVICCKANYHFRASLRKRIVPAKASTIEITR